MKLLDKRQLVIHSSMCVIGGFIGAYTIMNRGGNLGSAQTMNMIDIVLAICGRSFWDFLIRIGGLIIYTAGVFSCTVLSKKTKMNMQRYAITVDMIGFVGLCLIPENVNDFLALYPVFFIISNQWTVFHGMHGYNCSTIFSTNNLRQLVSSLGEYACDKDRAMLKKAGFFANSLLWFHLGVAAAYFGCTAFGIYSVLLCFVPALLSLALTFIKSEKPLLKSSFLSRTEQQTQ